MSNNISVKVDGVSTNLTVDKLRTATEGNRSIDWIPEPNLMVSNLKVHRNGTYEAEDMGVVGFDVVNVAVDKHGGAGATLEGDPHGGELVVHELNIQEGEQGRVMGGTMRLKLNMQGGGTKTFVAEEDVDIDTGTLNATANGRYRARSANKYAYTKVIVNVQDGGGGGGGGGDDPDDPYAPSNLPKYIAGGPLQIAYNDGDTIALQNGDIKAYKEIYSQEGRNTLWTSPDYPDGGIPTGEITLGTKTAEFIYAGDITVGYETNLKTPFMVTTTGRTYHRYNGDVRLQFSPIGAVKMVLVSPNSSHFYIFAASLSNNDGFLVTNYPPGSQSNTETVRCEYAATTLEKDPVYYNWYYYSNHGSDQACREISEHEDEYINADVFVTVNKNQLALALFYGTQPMPTSQNVSMSWPRPVDGNVLTGSFNILVYPAGTDLGYGGEVVGEGGTQSGT